MGYPMKNLRPVIFLSSVLASGFCALVACTDNDTVITSTDSGTDGSADTSLPDTGSPADGGTEAQVFPDSGITLENYRTVLAEAVCRNLARCCFGSPTLQHDAGVDGGAFDRNACLTFYTQVGFEGASGELPETNTNLTLDKAKGDECIGRLDTLTCTTPGAMYTEVAKPCFAALVGKLAAGAACSKSVECQPGHFCNNGGDGGTGACTPLRALDQSCGDWIREPDASTGEDPLAAQAEESCSYRGKGVDTGRYCDWFDFPGGNYRPQSEWKCKAAGGVGANCATTAWCKDALCEELNTATCVASRDFFGQTPPGSGVGCGKFVK